MHTPSGEYSTRTAQSPRSPHSALASLSSAGSTPSHSQMHPLHPRSSQFHSISCRSSQENLASFQSPLPHFPVPVTSTSSSEPAAVTSPVPRTPEVLGPLSLKGDVTALGKRELPPVNITPSPSQDALSRVESKTSLCPLKGAKGSALEHCLPHLSFWTLYAQDPLPRHLISPLCLSNSSTNFRTLPRHHLLQEAFSAFQTESGASSGCPQLPQLLSSAHSGY